MRPPDEEDIPGLLVLVLVALVLLCCVWAVQEADSAAVESPLLQWGGTR